MKQYPNSEIYKHPDMTIVPMVKFAGYDWSTVRANFICTELYELSFRKHYSYNNKGKEEALKRYNEIKSDLIKKYKKPDKDIKGFGGAASWKDGDVAISISTFSYAKSKIHLIDVTYVNLDMSYAKYYIEKSEL